MRFLDETTILVRAGQGGSGAVSFHREPYVPKGGPDGGNGGDGGSVLVVADPQLSTLKDIALNRIYRAENGKPGQGGKRSGKSGRDLVLRLPVGTIIRDADTGDLIADLTTAGEPVLVAVGGKGGRGNAHFATPRNRTPRRAEPGRPGQQRRLALELKLIADVGLVGKPNAGKSTLLRALSRARPAVADYPFTTLSPVLGMVRLDAYRRLVMADLPGLIEGASEGKGLGHRFLRHIERTRMLLLLIEAPEPDYDRALEQLLGELNAFNPELAARPRLVVQSKSDLPSGAPPKSFYFDARVSALSGEGLDELVALLERRLAALPA